MDALRKQVRPVAATIAASAAAIMFGFGATPAFAVHNDGNFQIEGDVCGGGTITTGTPVACVDTPPADDWDSLFTCSGAQGNCTLNVPPGNAAEPPTFVYDPGNVSVFTGGGSKDQEDIPSWLWKDGSAPDKDNIIEAFAAVYRPTGASARAGHKLLYFGANRLAVDGDAQIGFWFFQNNVAANGPPSQGGNQFTGTHKIGDVLILSNFVKGGGQSNIQVFVVQSIDAAGNVTFSQPFGSNTTNGNLVCAGGPSNDIACAATNGTISSALDPAFVPKAGAATGQYAVVGFFEGGIDLTEAGILLGIPLGSECFGSFLVETRSSQSITAVLKDFTLGAFESCTLNTKTDILDSSNAIVTDTTIPSGSTIHDVLTITAGLGNPAIHGTATFKFFNNSGCNAADLVDTQTGVAVVDGGGQNPPVSTATSSSHGPLAAGSYSFLAQYNGDDLPNYPGVTVNACENVTVSSPGVSITKSCVATHDATTVTVNFSGTVTNTGSEALHSVLITDNPVSGNITQPPGGTLAVGAHFDYSGSYVAASITTSDTAKVEALGVNNGAVSDTKGAQCNTTVSPSIHVTKSCTTKLVTNDAAGRLVVKDTVSGNVCNTGDVQVTLNTLVDTKAGNLFSSLSSTSLAPSACATYSGSYFPTSLTGTNGTASDSVTATGTGAITNASLSDDEPASCDLCPLGSGGAPNGT
jgi:hypothetical protein